MTKMNAPFKKMTLRKWFKKKTYWLKCIHIKDLLLSQINATKIDQGNSTFIHVAIFYILYTQEYIYRMINVRKT